MRLVQYCKVAILVVLAILLASLVFVYSRGFDAYIVDEACSFNGKLYLSLSSTNSSTCITGYKYRIKGDTIELKVFAGGPLIYSPEEYSGKLDIVITLPRSFQNKNIEIHKYGSDGESYLKTVFVDT